MVNFRQCLSRLRHKCRLIALAPERSWSEPGRVSLHQYAIEGDACSDIAQGLRLGVGEVAGERDEKAEIERAPRLLPTPAETMHYAAKAGRCPVFFQHLKKVVPGVCRAIFWPAMNQDRRLRAAAILSWQISPSR